MQFSNYNIFQDHKPVFSEKWLEIHFTCNIISLFLIVLCILKAKIKPSFSQS